ncbi:MAG TPA: hypothetical protein VIM16_09985 [Mucilaginibacter sp.]|jgi:hypothetical protein
MEKLFNRVNEEDGISAFVILGRSGKFHAIYRDDDSGNNIITVICPTLEVAIKKCNGFF